jgi:hypothetical protein
VGRQEASAKFSHSSGVAEILGGTATYKSYEFAEGEATAGMGYDQGLVGAVGEVNVDKIFGTGPLAVEGVLQEFERPAVGILVGRSLADFLGYIFRGDLG